jgi:hypothetical protein
MIITARHAKPRITWSTSVMLTAQRPPKYTKNSMIAMPISTVNIYGHPVYPMIKSPIAAMLVAMMPSMARIWLMDITTRVRSSHRVSTHSGRVIEPNLLAKPAMTEPYIMKAMEIAMVNHTDGQKPKTIEWAEWTAIDVPAKAVP